MLALIDADIVAFRCAASAEGESEDWIARARVKELMEQILFDTKADSWKAYLTGPNREDNFRRKIYPAYKANRDKYPVPKWLASCKSYLVNDWQAEVTNGIEADDALGIEQLGNNTDTIICSIDKDLLQIPGQHYNFVKKIFENVTITQGWYNFYLQLLIGDTADNIKGCPGIGKKKAPMVLEGCETEQIMFTCVREVYNDDDAMFLNGQLLYIWRKPNDVWNPERLIKQEVAPSSESIQLTQAATTRFTELG